MLDSHSKMFKIFWLTPFLPAQLSLSSEASGLHCHDFFLHGDMVPVRTAVNHLHTLSTDFKLLSTSLGLCVQSQSCC